jgi:hypothetical protein
MPCGIYNNEDSRDLTIELLEFKLNELTITANELRNARLPFIAAEYEKMANTVREDLIQHSFATTQQ